MRALCLAGLSPQVSAQKPLLGEDLLDYSTKEPAASSAVIFFIDLAMF